MLFNNQSCFELLASLEDKTVDLVLLILLMTYQDRLIFSREKKLAKTPIGFVLVWILVNGIKTLRVWKLSYENALEY